MADSNPEAKSQKRARSGTEVEDGTARRPFMRGIMVHSLMSRGLPFADAYRVANQVRDRLRGVPVVTRPELASIVSEPSTVRLVSSR